MDKKKEELIAEIFERIWEKLCAFSTKGHSEDYNAGYCDALSEVDERLQALQGELVREAENSNDTDAPMKLSELLNVFDFQDNEDDVDICLDEYDKYNDGCFHYIDFNLATDAQWIAEHADELEVTYISYELADTDDPDCVHALINISVEWRENNDN